MQTLVALGTVHLPQAADVGGGGRRRRYLLGQLAGRVRFFAEIKVGFIIRVAVAIGIATVRGQRGRSPGLQQLVQRLRRLLFGLCPTAIQIDLHQIRVACLGRRRLEAEPQLPAHVCLLRRLAGASVSYLV